MKTIELVNLENLKDFCASHRRAFVSILQNCNALGQTETRLIFYPAVPLEQPTETHSFRPVSTGALYFLFTDKGDDPHA